MPIDPQVFRAAFNRFQAINQAKCGFPLASFRNPASFAFIEEDYKEDVARAAVRAMDAPSWRTAEIGTGVILDRVIHAIEQRGNNLLQWEPRNGPQSRVHAKMLEAREDAAKLSALEKIFFDLYHQNLAGQTEFEALAEICGYRYELLAYLFFIADRHQFLPIRTKSFDKVLLELGFDFKTAWQCSWENYQEFLSAMRTVQSQLQAEGITDATLLDAHSFCWILARTTGDGVPTPPVPARIIRRMFAGSLHEAGSPGAFTPNDAAPPVDMAAVAQRRVASGQIAEEFALLAERERLREEGRADLAERAQKVSDRPGLGFDLQSFDADETPRCIEVKNVSGGNRFFLSDGEWRNSRGRSNYWFYLVSGVDENRPVVTFLAAAQIQPPHLQATQYLVTFTP